jgi:hypothetical protein
MADCLLHASPLCHALRDGEYLYPRAHLSALSSSVDI